MIEKSLVIGPSDDKRAHIIGVFIETIENEENNILRMVSTDGSRLSKVDYMYGKESGFSIESGVIIPKKGLNEVGKFLDAEGIVQITLKDNNFIIRKRNGNDYYQASGRRFP